MKRRAAAQPVAPGSDPSPAAATRSAQAAGAIRTPVPPERPASISNARSPSADAPGNAPPPPPSRGGEGGGARAQADDSFDSDSENIIVRPDSINASRRDADNARRRLSGQDDLEVFDKSGVSFGLYDICKHKHFLRISVLQVADLSLCAG